MSSVSIETFDDFLSTQNEYNYQTEKPFQFRDDKSAKGTLDWLVKNMQDQENAAQSRMITYRKFQYMYKGIQWKITDPRDYNRNDQNYGRRKPRMVTNFTYEMVETKTSQLAKNKINVAVIPTHSEQEDINNAKACKMLIDYRSEEVGLDAKQTDADRTKFVFGHAFLWIFWNKNSGDLAPAYQRILKRNKGKLPEKIKKELKKEDIKIGDVDVRVVGPDLVYPEMGKATWEEVNYVHVVEYIHIEELKADYPHKAKEIKEQTRNSFQYDLNDYDINPNRIRVNHFYHIPTKHLKGGEYIIFTDSVMLKRTKYPYDHGKLPLVSDTDIDIYGEIWGRSFITNIEQQQRMHNNIMSSIARNDTIAAAPKWIVPKGACKVSALNNDLTIVEFSGPVAPRLETHRHTNPQSFELQDRLEKYIQKASNVNDITRGEPPKGVTANSALRFLDEQEAQRNQTIIAKRSKRVLDTYKMMMSVMGQYYKESDGRVVRILGKDNQYMIKSLAKADFTKAYDIKMQNSSALPDTKTGRISTIIDLNLATQADPIFKKEEIIQMLDLGLDNAFKDQATVSVTAANTILQDLRDGEEIPEPQIQDNFDVHYDIFTKALRGLTFRTQYDHIIKERLIQHITVMEGLMFQKAMKNQKFLMILMDNSDYPLFFETPAPLASLLMMPPGEGQTGPDTSKIKVEQPKEN